MSSNPGIGRIEDSSGAFLSRSCEKFAARLRQLLGKMCCFFPGLRPQREQDPSQMPAQATSPPVDSAKDKERRKRSGRGHLAPAPLLFRTRIIVQITVQVTRFASANVLLAAERLAAVSRKRLESTGFLASPAG